MNVKRIVVGELATNCYIIEKESTCIIIDPGAEPEKIIKHVDPDKRVVGIFITHGHDDHTGALTDVYNKFICPIFSGNNLREEEYEFDELKFKIVKFPGHKEDSVALYFELEKVRFVGDFVFKDSIGRVDLKGASAFDMKQSIKKLLEFPKDVVLFPGHMQSTTIGEEVESLNKFINII